MDENEQYRKLLGEKIRELRGERSVYECADACGIDQTNWGRYERGVKMPTPATLERIASYFGVQKSEIYAAMDYF